MHKYITLRKKHFLFLILMILLVCVVSFFTTYSSIYKSIHQNTLNDIKTNLQNKIEMLYDFIHKSERLVLTLAQQKLLIDSISDTISDKERLVLEEEYKAIADVNHIIMQLRYIDKNGMEAIRVDRQIDDNAQAYALPKSALQNKKNRYYFELASKLQKGETWISDIDLNIEHGKIEKPYKPTVRVATAVYTDGKFNGIIIVNLHLEAFLEKLRSSHNYHLLMTDAKGNILLDKDPKFDWAKYLKLERSLQTEYGDIAHAILTHKEFSNDSLYSRQLYLKDKLQIYTIVINEIKETVHSKNIVESLKVAVPIFIIGIVLIFLFVSGWIITQVKKFNQSLQTTVEAQISELSIKDAMLIKQSRHAAMGEMLSMIAHQWRQPLTVISSITSNLNMHILLDKTTPDMTQKSINDIDTQISYLSQTITDFRDFFQPNKEKKVCNVKELLEKCMTLVTKDLDANNINLSIETPEKLSIYTYANELQQIILNIINNAKDAIISNKVEDGLITIKATEIGQQLKIEICDNGGGIPDDVMKRIMEPYFSTKGDNGTGLGLYMSEIIMQMHLKGKIHVYNKDKGACFELLLLINPIQ